jgi:hypothetical protein
MAKFNEIKSILDTRWRCQVDWEYVVEEWTYDHDGMKVILQPDFQRDYVWTETQQISYIENMLKGFPAGRDVFFNHPTWGSFHDADKYPIVCLDGQQRLGAVKAFMTNQIPIFGGNYRKDFSDHLPSDRAYFNVNVSCLKTKQELINTYIAFNFAGTAHDIAEAEKLEAMLKQLPAAGIESLEG